MRSLHAKEDEDLYSLTSPNSAKQQQQEKFKQSLGETRKAQGMRKKTTTFKDGTMVISSTDEKSSEDQLLLCHTLSRMTITQKDTKS